MFWHLLYEILNLFIQLEANDRHIIARRCAPEIAAYQRKRKLARRSTLAARDVTGTDSALQPHETTIKNDTCVTGQSLFSLRLSG